MKLVILDGETIVPRLSDGYDAENHRIKEIVFYGDTPAELALERMSGAQFVLTNKVTVTASMMEQLPDLRYIGVLATGYNVVDVAAARRLGITVTNIPSYSTDSVAQMVWAHILNIYNRVDHYARENREGRWCRTPLFTYSDFSFHELSGQTMGVVGLGNIGMKVALIARAFGMKVLAFTSKPQPALPDGVLSVPLDTLFGDSDVISLHCPLTDSTREMVNAHSLALMKPGVVVINTGRGPLVNEQDVANALNAGCIAAFGADVLSVEPACPDNPLLSAANCYLTPHIAWTSLEAKQRLIDICISNIRAFLDGHPTNTVW